MSPESPTPREFPSPVHRSPSADLVAILDLAADVAALRARVDRLETEPRHVPPPSRVPTSTDSLSVLQRNATRVAWTLGLALLTALTQVDWSDRLRALLGAH